MSLRGSSGSARSASASPCTNERGTQTRAQGAKLRLVVVDGSFLVVNELIEWFIRDNFVVSDCELVVANGELMVG